MTKVYRAGVTVSSIQSPLLMAWPKHLSLTLSHNEHKAYYETVSRRVTYEDHGCGPGDWVSDEQREEAIATDELWTLQWYPETPVGFNIKSAATLEALMAWFSDR